MRTRYKITMSDGSLKDISANSAAEAIQQALKLFPGETVKKCHAGLTGDEAHKLQQAGIGAMAGAIHHEIPIHKPMTAEQAAMKLARTLPDETEPMFDDLSIRAESKIAKGNFEHRSVFSET